jgi:hypothetical protein
VRSQRALIDVDRVTRYRMAGVTVFQKITKNINKMPTGIENNRNEKNIFDKYKLKEKGNQKVKLTKCDPQKVNLTKCDPKKSI